MTEINTARELMETLDRNHRVEGAVALMSAFEVAVVYWREIGELENLLATVYQDWFNDRLPEKSYFVNSQGIAAEVEEFYQK